MKQYLYFSAPWCGPCRMLGPIMERVNNTIPVQKVNVDENSELAMEYNVRNVPTVVLLENGQEVKRLIGMNPEARYLEVLDRRDDIVMGWQAGECCQDCILIVF